MKKSKLLLNVVAAVVLFSFNFSQAKQTLQITDTSTLVDPNASCHNDTQSRYMRAVRTDRHIPCDCKPFNIHQFKGKVNYYIQGIRSTKGADQKLDLNRNEARDLWKAFNIKNDPGYRQQLLQELSADPRLQNYIEILEANKDLQDFQFNSEGDVLEALAIAEKEESYPPPMFFVTGGVSYGEDPARVMGELDIIVFERATCSVVLVGEAKLGKGVSEARKQLARFRNFVNKH